MIAPLFLSKKIRYDDWESMLGITLTKRDWWFAAGWGIILAAISFIPHLVAYLRTPEGFHYMQTAHPVWVDSNSYFAWIRQAADGHWLFDFAFTSEPHLRAMFHPVFLVMGLLVRVGIPLAFVWYGVDFLAAIALGMTIYLFSAWFFRKTGKRVFATVLTSTGGGFGFIYYLLHAWPSDQWLPVDIGLTEATIGRSILWPFIFELAVVLLLWSFMLFLRYCDTGRTRLLVLAAITGFFLNITHPYDAMIFFLVLTVYTFIRYQGSRLKALILLMSVALLPTLYHLILVLVDPVFRAHSNFNLYSPFPAAYVLGFGFLLVLAAVGALAKMFSRVEFKERHWMFLIVWTLLVPVMVYFPVNFQRRLIEGAIVPIGMLAAAGCMTIWETRFIQKLLPSVAFLRALIVGAVSVGVVFTFGFTALVALVIDVQDVVRGGFPYYLSDNELEAASWLDSHASESDVLLASSEMGNFLPRLTGSRVYMGHGMQTVRAIEKYQEVIAFFTGNMTIPEREAFVQDRGIAYVWYGPRERLMGHIDFPPGNFTRVFSNGTVEIFTTKTTSPQ